MVAKILISPDINILREEITKTLASHMESGNTNQPDVLYLEAGEKLGVEQAKKIRGHLSFKPFQAKGRGVVLEDASSLTVEAQNALLKTLEELTEDALFIMGTSNEHNFLPTVLSRCEVVRLQLPKLQAKNNPTSEVGYEKDINKLLEANMPERFEYVEKLKDKQEFLQALVQYFHQTLASHMSSGNVDYMKFTKELLEAEKWASSNVNIRAILEYLMLIMPQE